MKVKKKGFLFFLLISLALIVIGGSLFIIPLAANNLDFSILENCYFETFSYAENAEQPIHTLQINTTSSDVLITTSSSYSEVQVYYDVKYKNSGSATNSYETQYADGVFTLTEKRENNKEFFIIF